MTILGKQFFPGQETQNKQEDFQVLGFHSTKLAGIHMQDAGIRESGLCKWRKVCVGIQAFNPEHSTDQQQSFLTRFFHWCAVNTRKNIASGMINR
jgi:hypothetical protein